MGIAGPRAISSRNGPLLLLRGPDALLLDDRSAELVLDRGCAIAPEGAEAAATELLCTDVSPDDGLKMRSSL